MAVSITTPFLSPTALEGPRAHHDFQLGMARQVVVFHDKNFQRLCGVEGLIYETNLADLPLIKHPSEVRDLLEEEHHGWSICFIRTYRVTPI